MKPDVIFPAVNGLAFLTWLILIIRPRHPLVLRLAGCIVPLLFAAVYAVVIAWRMGSAEGDFSTLAGVAAMFRDPWILLAGWVHYLAFDMLIGVRELRDAAIRGIPHWRVAPCLVLTFLFGPAGWLLYQVVRSLPAAKQSDRIAA